MTSVSISTTKNTVTVDEDNPSVITVATQGPQGPAFSDGDLGDIVISGNGTIATIDNGVVNNAKIASDAAIALSKLATGALPTAITVTSANISDLSILNADVNASAAIAGTKISPDFGSQNIVTTGNITIADVTAASLDISGNADIDGTLEADAYTVNGTALNEYIADTIGAMVSGNTETNIAVTYDDADNTLDFSVVNITGNAATATALETARTIGGTSFDGSANIDISYNNLTNKLSVGDGGLTQNNFTDTLKTKLDGIETAATADQTAAEILTALKTVDGSTSGLDADLLDGRDTSNSGTANTIALRDANGDLFATTFSGSGASLTSLPASQLTGAIANGVTATTQSASDNSTKVATTAYADTAIANLVDSSPSALNTLNELAAALGDDANFSTTVTNNIATKLSLSGGTLTGTLELDGDLWLDASGTASRDVFWDSSESIFRFYNSAKATFGNSDDLQIYHDGTNSWIKEAGTNRLIIDTDGQGIDLTKTGATEYLLRTAIDGAVELYYDGAKKLETTSGGISMSGEIHLQTNHLYGSDNAKIRLGGAQDLQIYHDGTYNTFAGANFLVRNAAANESLIYAVENGAAELWYDNSKKLETATWGTQIHGVLATTSHVDIASDSGILKLGASADLQIYHDGSHSHIVNSTGNLRILADGAGDLVLTSKAGEEAIKCVQDGNVQLMYDNSKKLETTSTGVLVTELTNSGNTTFNGSYVTFSGTNTAAWDKSNTRLLFNDNAKAAFGTGVDLTIYHGGTNSIIENITGDLYFKNTNNFFLQVNASEAAIYARPNAAVELYYDASKKLETHTNGVHMSGSLYLPDSEIAGFGDVSNPDLRIYHDGTHSYITNTTGDVYQRSANFLFQNAAGTENKAIFLDNGSVELYYDNSKKFETFANGVRLFDTQGDQIGEGFDGGFNFTSLVYVNELRLMDSEKIQLGAGLDLQIYHEGPHSVIQHTNTSGYLELNTDNFRLMDDDGSLAIIKGFKNASVELYYDNVVKLQTESWGVLINDQLKLTDSKSLFLGTGNDLQIFHDGTNSHIYNATGELRIRGGGDGTVRLMNAAGNEHCLIAEQNAAVTLYHDNVKKFETTADGGTFTGQAATFVTLNTYESSTATKRGSVYVNNSNTVGLLDSQNHWVLNGTKDGNSILYYDNSTKLYTTSTGAQVSGDFRWSDGEAGKWGNSQDLQIYHNGTDNVIGASGGHTTKFYGPDFEIYSLDGTKTCAKFDTDNSVELYFNSSKKLETTSYGLWATGQIYVTHSGTTAAFSLSDNGRSAWGSSNDLQIYHDGSNTFFDNLGTGSVVHRIQSGDIYFQYYDGSSAEDMAVIKKNGSVELYHDNSKKFQTHPDGSEVIGHLLMTDNNKIKLGDSSDLELVHDGTDSFIGHTLGSGLLRINAAAGSEIRLTKSGPETLARFIPDGAVELMYDNSKKLSTQSYGIQFVDAVVFDNPDNAGKDINWATELNTLRFEDDVKATFGGSDDLQLYHDGSTSFIKDAGTGNLEVWADGSHIFKSGDGTENKAIFDTNGSVELYYDNSKKLETISWGAKVTGNLEATGSLDVNEVTINGTTVLNSSRSLYNLAVLELADNIEARFGSSNDLKIYHDGSHSRIHNDVGSLLIEADDANVQINKGNTENMATFNRDAAVELYYDNSKKLETASWGTQIHGVLATTSHVDIANNSGILKLGASADLQIYHNGTYSAIQSDNLKIIDKTNGHGMITALVDGAVGLRYDNVEKLTTTSDGITISGKTLAHDDVIFAGANYNVSWDKSSNYMQWADNAQALFGSDGDVRIYHDGTDNYWETGATTTHFRINNGNRLSLKSDGNVMMQGSGGKNLEFEVATGFLTFTDNTKAVFGTDNDTQIYHDGSNAYLKNDTGNLHIATNGGTYIYGGNDFGEYCATFLNDGAVKLYYDHSKKLETTSAGATLTGDLLVSAGIKATTNFAGDDNVKLKLGTGDDLQLYHDGSNSNIKNGTGWLNVYAGGNGFSVGNGDFSENLFKAANNGAVELYYDNGLKIKTTSAGVQMPSGTYFQFDAASSHAWAIGATTGADLPAGSGTALQFHYWNNSAWDKISYQSADGIGVTDSKKFIAGDSDDLQIYHNGNSYLKKISAGNGDLYIDSDGSSDLYLRAGNGSTGRSISIRCYSGAGVDLRYDGAKQCETNSNGMNWADGKRAYFGNSSDLQIYHDGSHSYIKNTTGVLHIQGNNSDDLKISPHDGEDSIILKNGAAVELYHANSKRFQTNASGAEILGAEGGDANLFFYADEGDDAADKWLIQSESDGFFALKNYKDSSWEISLKSTGAANVELYYDNSKKLETLTNGAKVSGELHLDSNGSLIKENQFKFSPSGAAYIDHATTGQSVNFRVSNSSSLDTTALTLASNGNATFAGTVTCTSLTETSDIALKTNIEPITNVLDKINQITGYKYDFTKSNSSSIGVIAQDVEKVFPELVHGEEGSKSLQYSGLIGALIESVKELSAKVAALESGS